VRAQIAEQSDFEKAARERWATYFLDYASNSIVRNNTLQHYWNCLVDDVLVEIDLELTNLLEVLMWSNKANKQILLELTIVLVHYLERVGRYKELIFYAMKAAEAASGLNRKEDEALIRIDTIGWTLIEEGKLEDAGKEIEKGLCIATGTQFEEIVSNDLIALAYAFLARMYIFREDHIEASKAINKSLQLTTRSHVGCRVLRVAGEIASERNEYNSAITYFNDASLLAREYQERDIGALDNHLGFAYLALGHLQEAEHSFTKSLDAWNHKVKVLIGKYGLARVHYKKGEYIQANMLAQEALSGLKRLRLNHRLLNEVKAFCEQSRILLEE
jgi:LuxR family glucitol operon transcriptional activator